MQSSDVLIMLMRGHSTNGKLGHKLIGHINEKFSVSRAKICRLWSKYRHMHMIIGREAPKLPRKSGLGRRMKHIPDDLKGWNKDVFFHKRKILHSLAHVAGIPCSTLDWNFKKGLVQCAKSTVKPHLTPAGIQKRYEYAQSFIEPDGQFNDMMNKVHIDEKWFYDMMTKRHCYLLPDKKMIEHWCKHKSHIEKVMFGAALACPCQNPVTGE